MQYFLHRSFSSSLTFKCHFVNDDQVLAGCSAYQQACEPTNGVQNPTSVEERAQKVARSSK